MSETARGCGRFHFLSFPLPDFATVVNLYCRSALNTPQCCEKHRDETRQGASAVDERSVFGTESNLPFVESRKREHGRGWRALARAIAFSSDGFLQRWGTPFGLLATASLLLVCPSVGLSQQPEQHTSAPPTVSDDSELAEIEEALGRKAHREFANYHQQQPGDYPSFRAYLLADAEYQQKKAVVLGTTVPVVSLTITAGSWYLFHVLFPPTHFEDHMLSLDAERFIIGAALFISSIMSLVGSVLVIALSARWHKRTSFTIKRLSPWHVRLYGS